MPHAHTNIHAHPYYLCRYRYTHREISTNIGTDADTHNRHTHRAAFRHIHQAPPAYMFSTDTADWIWGGRLSNPHSADKIRDQNQPHLYLHRKPHFLILCILTLPRKLTLQSSWSMWASLSSQEPGRCWLMIIEPLWSPWGNPWTSEQREGGGAGWRTSLLPWAPLHLTCLAPRLSCQVPTWWWCRQDWHVLSSLHLLQYKCQENMNVCVVHFYAPAAWLRVHVG